MTGEAMRFAHHTRLDGFRWTWPHFTPIEMADRLSGDLVIVPAFMDWLEDVRKAYAKPMIITSGYRTPLHQKELSGDTTGAHVDGMAIDILVYGHDAHMLNRIASAHGALGIGWHQKGAFRGRYLHIDRWLNGPRGLRPWIWSY